MGLFDNFPYTNFHELNLDWMLNALRVLEHTIDDFVAINALKYADPIQWNITSQYEKNTIVIDPQTGTAYISVQPVPSGVSLTNTDYWTVVFDLGSFVVKASKNFTDRYEAETTTTATFSSNIGDWLVWADTLYIAISNITAGDAYVINSNIRHFTIEDIIGHLTDLTTVNQSNIVAAINELVSSISAVDAKIGDLDNLITTDKSNTVAAINENKTNIDNIAVDVQDLLSKDGTANVYTPAMKAQKNQYATTLSGDANYNSIQGCAYNSNANRLLIAIIHDDSDGMLIEVDTDYTTVIRRKAFTGGELRHANDITYNPDTNKYYIAGYTDIIANESNCLIEIDASTLDYIQTIDLDPPSTDGNYVAGKVCYDANNKIYYTYGNKQINSYDNSFNLLSTIDMEYGDLLPEHYSILGRDIKVCQAMEFYNNKLAFIIEYDINRNASIIALTETDGTYFGCIPVYGSTQAEPEGLFIKDNLLYVMCGQPQYLVMAMVPQTVGLLPIGKSPLMTAKTLPDGADLDELLELGYYTCVSGTSAATINGSPTMMSYQLFVGCLGANTLQIAYNNFTIALRVIAYNNTITPWRYIYGNPVGIERSMSNFFVDGVLSDSMTAIYATIPTGYVRNATIGDYTAWIRGNAGFVTDGIYAQGMQSTNCTASIVAFNDHGITMKFVRNDNQPFTNGTNNTPVTLQFAPFKYTEV